MEVRQPSMQELGTGLGQRGDSVVENCPDCKVVKWVNSRCRVCHPYEISPKNVDDPNKTPGHHTDPDSIHGPDNEKPGGGVDLDDDPPPPGRPKKKRK